ncbi:MAG: S8 family serine peptidase [Dokdonella sp.]
MSNRHYAPFLALLFGLFAQPAGAFWDPPYVTPTTATANDIVSVNEHLGVCDAFFFEDGYPQITRNGSEVKIVSAGVHLDPGDDGCNLPTGTVTYELGSFPAGHYSVTYYLRYTNFFGQVLDLNLGTAPFTIVAAPISAESAPTLTAFGICVLILALMGLSVLRIPRTGLKRLMGFSACLLFNGHANAAPSNVTIEFSLNNSPGAPTPAQVVSYYNKSPRSGAPPLQAFTVVTPQAVGFLIPDRATGDFLDWLGRYANRNSARTKLEGMMAGTVAPADVSTALAALRADPYVESANEPLVMEATSVSLQGFSVTSNTAPFFSNDQYGRDDLNIDAAWQLAGGYALVGLIEYGVAIDHPALRQFDTTLGPFTGGNFIKALSKDVSFTGLVVPSNFTVDDVDEAKPVQPADSHCTSQVPALVGHGTHAAGLVAANGASGQGVQGTCKHCGLSVWKYGLPRCFVGTPSEVRLTVNGDGISRAQAQAVDIGAQILNMSLGAPASSAGLEYCHGNATLSACRTLSYAKSRDTIDVASSGNDRTDLKFPASDPRVISVGGYNSGLAFWDESPGGTTTSCPYPNDSALNPNTECGSNKTNNTAPDPGYNHQELTAAAKSVLSTTYPNKNWNSVVKCGDQFQVAGTSWGDGIGLCTGTSMSAPQIAGVVGILRSINPLVLAGTPEPNGPWGIRAVLAKTTTEARLAPPQPWNSLFGYGHPDAAAAARKMLGTVETFQVRNRATPLFRLHSVYMKDFADVASPQFALSLMINQAHQYVQPTSYPVSGYTFTDTYAEVPGYIFPYDSVNEEAPAKARAPVYILTTEYKPRTEYPALVPLYLMRKKDAATAFTPDYLLSTPSDVQAIHAANYDLLTIQGYIYGPCGAANESTCVLPPGTERFYRACKTVDNDCATFLESEIGLFPGYTATFPLLSGSPTPTKTLLGYAYKWGDNDPNPTPGGLAGDGLPDAFEYVVGTDPTRFDSDGDGLLDKDEFPMIGVPISDPCANQAGTGTNGRYCLADKIFANGFNQ